MADTYGELICHLCKLRDEMRKTDAGRIALGEVINTLVVAVGRRTTYEKAKELMDMTDEKVAAMTNWTLEDFQNDPLGAMEQVRELAAAHLALQRKLDAAMRDMKEYGAGYGFTCEICEYIRGTEKNPCSYQADVDVTDSMCRACDKCPCGHCDGESQWRWRGLEEENRYDH